MIVIFVPANLTELAQPLDVGFNFVFKHGIFGKAGGCLRAKLEGKLVYLRLDKQAKRSGLWSVGVCNKSREQSGGEKPRATTVLKMTHDEIRAAVSAAAADEPAV